ncbi:GATA zinc finger domain-containing protein 14-like [Ctenocephalides felis]|uniref:GATA zinc finger domain-containing protein 14-like n=1 Tax=Ctenocephalides felis TaxID=7515 RepID=UPI000E6E50FD|nr:GATA zinc finger domain-containing protein 14-like [Ctenocephalides felis]
MSYYIDFCVQNVSKARDEGRCRESINDTGQYFNNRINSGADMWNARYGDYYYDSRNQFLSRQGHRRYSSYSHGYNMNNYDQQAMPNDYYHFQNPPMNQTGQYRSQRQHRYDSNLNNKYCDSYSMHYNQAISYANDNALHAKRYTTPKSDYINFTSNDRTPSNKSNCKTPSNISDNVSSNNISNNVTHKPTQNNENCSNVVDKSLVIHNNNKIQFSNKCDSNQIPKSSAINDLNHTNKIPVSSEVTYQKILILFP